MGKVLNKPKDLCLDPKNPWESWVQHLKPQYPIRRWEADRLHTGGVQTDYAGLRSSEPGDSDSNKVEDEDQTPRSSSDLYPSTLSLPSLSLTCMQARAPTHTHSQLCI